MTCSSTFLKYPSAVLACCIHFDVSKWCMMYAPISGKRYLEWTLPRIEAQIELSSTFVCDYKMSTSGSSAKNSHLTQGGTNDNDAHACEPNTLQCKIKLSQKYCPRITLQLWNFCHSFLRWMSSIFLDYYVLLCKIGSLAWASSFVPPSWGANSSQSCRSCSFSGHKRLCWTVLYELRYKVAYNPNAFFLNWKQRTAGKAVEDALQYLKMYEAGVWARTTKGYFENVVEQVIRRQSKVWSNL